MKKTTIITLALAAFFPFTFPQVLAQKEKDKKPASAEGSAHSHFTKIPATVEEIWKEIQKQQGKLAKVVAAKDLGEAHDHAFAIRDLVKALPGKSSAENKPKAEDASKTITKLAADIDKSGAAGAQKSTEANVKKLDAAIAALKVNLTGK